MDGAANRHSVQPALGEIRGNPRIEADSENSVPGERNLEPPGRPSAFDQRGKRPLTWVYPTETRCPDVASVRW